MRLRRSKRSRSCSGRARRSAVSHPARVHAVVLAAAFVHLAGRAQIVIDPDLPPVPLPNAIPQQGPPLHIPRVGDNYTWDDVDSWLGDAISSGWDKLTGLFGSVASFPVDLVKRMISDAVRTATTAWSSFVNLSIDYTSTAFDNATALVSDLTGYVLNEITFFGDAILYLSAGLDYLGNVVIRGIDDELHNVEAIIGGAIDAAIAGVEGWAIDNIYNPLDRLVRTIERDTIDRIESGLADVASEIADQVTAERLARLAEIAAIAGVVAGIAEWVDNCGDPMCQSLGPKTDLGKFLKTLNAALLAADLAAVLALDADGIETLIRQLVSRASGIETAFAEFFGAGGGSLGDVIGAL